MKKIVLLNAVFFFCVSTIIYAQPGELNSTFGNKGVIVEDFIKKANFYSESARQILPQNDGSYIVIIEAFPTRLSRFLSDGTLDNSFGKEGYVVVTNIVIEKSIQQSDGKIVIAGRDYNLSDGSTDGYVSLARYNTDGSVDNTFSRNGLKTYMDITSLAIQDDGKLVLAGIYAGDFALARYNSDGSPDLSFDEDAYLLQDFFGYEDKINSVAIQNDGKILVVGTIFIPLICTRCDPLDGSTNSVLVRYNSDGSLDHSFGPDGRMFVSTFIQILAKQSDGAILMVGFGWNGSNMDIFLERLNSNGGFDPCFYIEGLVRADFGSNDFPTSVAFQSDGKILVTAWTEGDGPTGSTDFALVRFNSCGKLDSSFSEDGMLTTDFGFNDFANFVAVQGNGKIVVAGGTTGIRSWDFALSRYNTNGTLDNTFSDDGKQIGYIPVGIGNLSSIAAQSDDKIVVAGIVFDSLYNLLISRYNPDGTPDKTFGDNGKQITDFGYNSSILSPLVIQSDGKIKVAVWSVSNTLAIARYNTNGNLDNTFGKNGKQVIDVGKDFPAFAASSIVLQDDSKILVGGSVSDSVSNQDFAIARYNSDGSLDKTFSDDGLQTTSFNSDLNWASSITIQNNKKIVMSGQTWNGNNLDFAIARYNMDGSLDNTFSSDGKQIMDFTSYNDYGGPTAIQNDGKILLAGTTNDSEGGNVGIIRFNTDGSLDKTFDKDGKITTDFGLINESAFSIKLQKDGKIIIVGGVFNFKNFFGDIAIARYNSDGSPDSSFNADGRLTTDFGGDEVGYVAVIIKDKLYVTGKNIIASYNLTDKVAEVPIVTLSIPSSIVKFTAPARIKLNATVTNIDAITKIRFYNGITLLHTETVFPFGFLWVDVPVGTYTLTAKAYDDQGRIVTSNAIEVSVVDENVAPVVRIVSPVDGTTYTGPATINLIARAKDPNDRISKVEFYNGSALLTTEDIYPYTFTWTNVQPGTYTLTAKATDDKDLSTTSDPVTVTVTAPLEPLVSSRSSSVSGKTNLNGTLSVKLSPNPASNILNIYAKGLQWNKQSSISVISPIGVVLKTIRSNIVATVVQLDVSSLKSGVYTIKIVSGDKIIYRQFVKL